MNSTSTSLIAWIAVAEFGLALITAIVHLIVSIKASSSRELALLVAREMERQRHLKWWHR